MRWCGRRAHIRVAFYAAADGEAFALAPGSFSDGSRGGETLYVCGGCVPRQLVPGRGASVERKRTWLAKQMRFFGRLPLSLHPTDLGCLLHGDRRFGLCVCRFEWMCESGDWP